MTDPRQTVAPSLRRRWVVAALSALLVVVVAVSIADRLGADRASAAPTATADGSPTHRSPTVRGEITAMSGDEWTVGESDGSAVTVDVAASTALGTRSAPADRSQFTTGVRVAVAGTRSGNTITADRVLLSANQGTTAPSPATTAAPATTTQAPAADTSTRCDVTQAAQAAVSAATDLDETAAVAVLDTQTGTYSAAGSADTEFSTASVVKVLIATDLLLTDQMSGDTEATAKEMITESDDDDADTLYDLVGGDDLLPTIAEHYGIADLGSPPAEDGQWGETQVTADGLAHLYAALHADPAVWPWLSQQMADTQETAADGTDQYFGIPAVAASWSVKQGWMTGLGPGSTYDSTGYVDDDRYVVVMLTHGSDAQYGHAMSATMTTMAKALMPDGTAPGSAC